MAHLAKSSGLIVDKAYINGQFVNADDGATFDVINPADGSVVVSVPDIKADQTTDTINKAYKAFQTWKTTTPKHRAQILKKWFALMVERREQLAAILTLEQGKVYPQALAEVDMGSTFVEWYAEECRRTWGETINVSAADRRVMTIKQPIGVCGLITPWNFPFSMITRKGAPALAAGCTIIIKPSEETPLCALALVKLAEEAGFPPGVFNVLPCSRSNAAAVGGALCKSALVTAISFTGSSAVGKILLEQSASTVKKLSLELGGNAPFIVFDKADVDAAVNALCRLKLVNAGQVCVSPNRMLVQAGIHDQFVAKLQEAMKKADKVGDGFNKDTAMGPLINPQAVTKVDNYVQDALKNGAKLALGGKKHSLGGNFYEVTLLTDVTPDMRCVKEEIFGPVAPIVKFNTEEEALAIANSTAVGLAGYFYSTDMAQCWRVAEALEVGMVGINSIQVGSTEGPFGGVKESGLGREGGRGGMDEYMEIKTMTFGGIH